MESHPLAALFPEMSDDDFAALKEDIRKHGIKTPILVHGGQILDGRHRYRACQELGIRCRTVEWDGKDPWLEVQSLNLMRRHLAKDQIYAIQKLALLQFPQLAGSIGLVKAAARARKAQARGRPRGEKALPKSGTRQKDRQKETADIVGASLGISGSTVKRVDRLARHAPALLPRVAAGEISVKQALRDLALVRREPAHLQRVLAAEWGKCPAGQRSRFLKALEDLIDELGREHASSRGARGQTSISSFR